MHTAKDGQRGDDVPRLTDGDFVGVTVGVSYVFESRLIEKCMQQKIDKGVMKLTTMLTDGDSVGVTVGVSYVFERRLIEKCMQQKIEKE